MTPTQRRRRIETIRRHEKWLGVALLNALVAWKTHPLVSGLLLQAMQKRYDENNTVLNPTEGV